jgi:hypothetical protein
MPASDLLDPRAVLGAVKAQPGTAGSGRKPSATAGLDRPLRATRATLCGPGRRNGLWLEQRNCAISGESDDITYQQFPAEVCERMRRDGGSVFRARANTGDPNGPIEACPLTRTHAR